MYQWQEWFERKQAESQMKAELIKLSEVKGWETTPEAVQRPDGAFFKVVGVNIAPNGEREVLSWDQPILQETGEGAIVLVYHDEKVLLQARAEPGNDSTGHVLLGPTLQASKSNLETAHGGKKPPRAELISDDVVWHIFSQDGGRYFHKKNHYAIVHLDKEIEASPSERWFSIKEICQAISTGHANEHLMQAFALLMCE